MIYYKIIILSCLAFLQSTSYYASSKYKSSVFPVCYLRLREPPSTQLNPRKTSIEDFTERRVRRGDVITPNLFNVPGDQEYEVLNLVYATAFYIGDGRFVTNFHLLTELDADKDYGHIFIRHKGELIHIDKGFEEYSAADLLVLHTNSEYVKNLIPLKISIPEVDNFGEVVPRFNYHDNYNAIMDTKVPEISASRAGRSDRIEVPGINGKFGMSGSPLLCKDQVIGIYCFHSTRIGEIDVDVFESSLHLLNLLKYSKISCSLRECIQDGFNRLMTTAKNGSPDAQFLLNIFVNNGKYIKKKYLESLKTNKTFLHPTGDLKYSRKD